MYAVIKERWSSRPGETICGGSQRDELVYSSLSNLVEIRVVAARRSGDYFMMKIEGMCTMHMCRIIDPVCHFVTFTFWHILYEYTGRVKALINILATRLSHLSIDNKWYAAQSLWQSLTGTIITLRSKLSSAVYCYRSCLWVCLQRAGVR